MRVRIPTLFTAALCMCWSAGAAFAQGWSIDARDIALGGTGNVRPLVSTMERFEDDTVIVLPFGLFQVLRDFGIYNPKSSHFDPVRAGAYLTSPLHYMRHRDEPPAEGEATDGFGAFGGDVTVGNVFAPRVGRTIPIRRSADGAVQGLYVGVGPYIGVRALTGSMSPDAGISLDGTVDEQLAVAVTVGYRGRRTLPARNVTVDLAVDYSFLRGVFYNRDDFDITLPSQDTIDIPTEATGQSTRSRATSGNGRAINVAVGVLAGRWGFGVGIDGIANRIHWSNVHETASVTFPIEQAPATDLVSSPRSLVVSMPLDYRGRVSYADHDWTFAAGVGHRFGSPTVNAGVERRLPKIALRGGLRYEFGRWTPSGGVGAPLSPRLSIDVAAFGSAANLANRRQLSIAVSFRVKSKTPRLR